MNVLTLGNSQVLAPAVTLLQRRMLTLPVAASSGEHAGLEQVSITRVLSVHTAVSLGMDYYNAK